MEGGLSVGEARLAGSSLGWVGEGSILTGIKSGHGKVGVNIHSCWVLFCVVCVCVLKQLALGYSVISKWCDYVTV